jgi:hypothetical protein
MSRSLTRRHRRTLARRLGRGLVRSHVRTLPGGRRGLDDLAQALTAWRRALRCQRNLARLAPRFFDAAVVDREAREQAERRRWIASWRPLLDKVYGPAAVSDQPADDAAELPRLPGRRTQLAVERELAGLDFWLAAGRLALGRHLRRRPHAILSLSQLARLIQIGCDFGGLACGLESSARPARSRRTVEESPACGPTCENSVRFPEFSYWNE